MLYLPAVRSIRLKGSAFGAYYHRLVAHGMKGCDALIAVMRKMLIVAYHWLRTHLRRKIWLDLGIDNFYGFF